MADVDRPDHCWVWGHDLFKKQRERLAKASWRAKQQSASWNRVHTKTGCIRVPGAVQYEAGLNRSLFRGSNRWRNPLFICPLICIVPASLASSRCAGESLAAFSVRHDTSGRARLMGSVPWSCAV